MMDRKVAVITGGNAGLGLMTAQRLLEIHPSIHICLACRSNAKAQAAAKTLMECFPERQVNITLLLVDVSNLESVYRAAEELKQRFEHIDYLYLNAGILPSTVEWSAVFKGLLSPKCVHMLTTGEGLLKQNDRTTSQGLKEIFATNVFGHFVLVKELSNYLGGNSSTQIIWTSSSNASAEAFSLADIQHANGTEPYASSKQLADTLSVAFNHKYSQKKIYSHTTCPGLVLTNMTYAMFPAFIWWLLFPFLCLFRILVPTLNLTSYNGAEALVWLTKQAPQALNPMSKYRSTTSFFGGRRVKEISLHIPAEQAEQAFEKLDTLEKEIRKKYRPSDLSGK